MAFLCLALPVVVIEFVVASVEVDIESVGPFAEVVVLADGSDGVDIVPVLPVFVPAPAPAVPVVEGIDVDGVDGAVWASATAGNAAAASMIV